MAKAVFNEKEALFDCKLDLKTSEMLNLEPNFIGCPKLWVVGK